MQKAVSDCIDCGKHCLGSFCSHNTVNEHCCDGCEDIFSSDEMYIYDGGEYCVHCLIEQLTKDGIIANGTA